MIYQLRFTETDTLSDFLDKTAKNLMELMEDGVWPAHLYTREARLRHFRRVLRSGLRTLLVRRTLCGSRPLCDNGCKPIPENLNPQRYSEIRAGVPVKRYLVEDATGLPGMAERLTRIVGGGFPGAFHSSSEIQRILKEDLAAHLFENIFCGMAFCVHSQRVELTEDLETEEKKEESLVCETYSPTSAGTRV